jgi:hypothetical protein
MFVQGAVGIRILDQRSKFSSPLCLSGKVLQCDVVAKLKFMTPLCMKLLEKAWLPS